jgi:hypothetical protein
VSETARWSPLPFLNDDGSLVEAAASIPNALEVTGTPMTWAPVLLDFLMSARASSAEKSRELGAFGLAGVAVKDGRRRAGGRRLSV